MYHDIQYIDSSEETISEVRSFLKEWYNEKDYIDVNTSGSTGKPTTIRLEKAKMIISARKTLFFLKIKKECTALLCLSPTTIAGKMMIVRSIIGELKLIVGSVNSNPLKNISEHIDFIAMVPLQLQQTLEHCPGKIRSIQSVIIGGGPISSLVISLLKKFNISVYHTYGMTETISHVALRRIGKIEEKDFQALPGIQFGTENEQLVIHYPEIGHDRLLTTDQVILTSIHSFEWIGRTDFIINSGGKKVNPEEVENCISQLISVQFFIFGLPDKKYGEKIVLIIESSSIKKISKESFNPYLTKHTIPKEIFYLPLFVRTQSGKINRIETMKLLEKHGIKEIL